MQGTCANTGRIQTFLHESARARAGRRLYKNTLRGREGPENFEIISNAAYARTTARRERSRLPIVEIIFSRRPFPSLTRRDTIDSRYSRSYRRTRKARLIVEGGARSNRHNSPTRCCIIAFNTRPSLCPPRQGGKRSGRGRGSARPSTCRLAETTRAMTKVFSERYDKFIRNNSTPQGGRDRVSSVRSPPPPPSAASAVPR